MKILEKYISVDFSGFDWLNFEFLPESKGFKFEINFNETEDLIIQSISHFHFLFKSVLSDILIRTFKPDGEWGNFCLDTWNIKNNKYDYSIYNKQEPSASYLSMLKSSNIEPNYSGFCRCLDWTKFLYITLNCVVKHIAPYSMMFYVPSKKFVFYFHHTGSIGLYYKELNEEIINIIKKANEANLEIRNTNDERVLLY